MKNERDGDTAGEKNGKRNEELRATRHRYVCVFLQKHRDQRTCSDA